MSQIAPEVLDRFQGITTLCTLWKLTSRAANKTVCATNHDQPVKWKGETYHPGLSLTSSVLRQTLTMAPEPVDLDGVLDADGLMADDLKAGVWDGATVTIWRVDWSEPDQGIWLWSGFLTDIEAAGNAFSCRLASIKSVLERTTGRVFGRRCDADFCDARCGLARESVPQDACDKRFATCRDVFDNAENFRGFPHMPGNDSLISGPGERRDGGSRGIER